MLVMDVVMLIMLGAGCGDAGCWHAGLFILILEGYLIQN